MFEAFALNTMRIWQTISQKTIIKTYNKVVGTYKENLKRKTYMHYALTSKIL